MTEAVTDAGARGGGPIGWVDGGGPAFARASDGSPAFLIRCYQRGVRSALKVFCAMAVGGQVKAPHPRPGHPPTPLWGGFPPPPAPLGRMCRPGSVPNGPAAWTRRA